LLLTFNFPYLFITFEIKIPVLKVRFLILFFIAAQYSAGLTAQVFNRPVPHGVLYPYEFIQYDTTDYGYYLTSPYNYFLNPTYINFIRPRAEILDKDGYVVWFSFNTNYSYWDFQYHADTSWFSCYYQQTPVNVNNHIVFLDSTFQIASTLPSYNNMVINVHEFQILPNGNAIYFTNKDSVMDLSAYSFGGVQGSSTTTVIAYVIQEFDRGHNLVFQWNSLDHIFPTENYSQYGYLASGFDYVHGNSISQDIDGNLLASFRHLNSIYKIDHHTGNVIWRLGGKSNSFTFPNDSGFSGQHDVRCQPDGTISIIDNANTSGHKSRAVVYSIDTNNWTATKTWEYMPSPSFYTAGMGNHQITADHNHLIDYGFSLRPNPSVDFVNNAGNKISQILFEDSVISYRSLIQKLPFNFPRPLITCSQGVNSVTLYAPAGFQTYLWSNNSLSDHITVSDTGIYMVWVNYGTGMVGSLPFHISNINSVCSSAGIQESLVKPRAESRYLIYDLLGRAINEPVDGHVYIFRYENGNSVLRYYIKE
jgi:hypothetical protein